MLVLDYDTGNRAAFGDTKVSIGAWGDNHQPTKALEVDGDISASLNSTGSFGTLRLAYDDLPTSDPSVKGAVWRDGTDLKISAG